MVFFLPRDTLPMNKLNYSENYFFFLTSYISFNEEKKHLFIKAPIRERLREIKKIRIEEWERVSLSERNSKAMFVCVCECEREWERVRVRKRKRDRKK